MMRALFVALLFLALLVLGCDPPCPDGYARDYIADAFTYPGHEDGAPTCRKVQDPPYSGQAVNPSKQCAAQPDDDPCVSCVRTSCCMEALSCTSDTTCVSLVQCSFADAGCTGQPDATYQTTAACLSAHCAADCPRLP